MIALLTGRIAEKRVDSVILDVGGVGYEVAMSAASLAALPPQGDTVTIHTRMQVRDDGAALFGFESAEEKDLFESLTLVSGVGPKVALAALSALTPSALRDAIAREDVARIAETPGIGKKTAQRIIVELKDRLQLPDLADIPAGTAPEAYTEATEALMGMGFSRSEVGSALAGLEEAAGAEDLVRRALKQLGGVG